MAQGTKEMYSKWMTNGPQIVSDDSVYAPCDFVILSRQFLWLIAVEFFFCHHENSIYRLHICTNAEIFSPCTEILKILLDFIYFLFLPVEFSYFVMVINHIAVHFFFLIQFSLNVKKKLKTQKKRKSIKCQQLICSEFDDP